MTEKAPVTTVQIKFVGMYNVVKPAVWKKGWINWAEHIFISEFADKEEISFNFPASIKV